MFSGDRLLGFSSKYDTTFNVHAQLVKPLQLVQNFVGITFVKILLSWDMTPCRSLRTFRNNAVIYKTTRHQSPHDINVHSLAVRTLKLA
jgi:hypothetical protein